MRRARFTVAVLLAAGCGLRAQPLVLRAVSPNRVCGSGSAELVLTGAGFALLPSSVLTAHALVVVPRVLLTPQSGAPLALADDAGGTPVRWVSAEELAVTLPLGGLGAGGYDVTVENPDGAQATLAAGLVLVNVRPLAITSVAPARFCDAGADETVTLAGTGFQAGATVEVLDAGGAQVLAPVASVAAGSLSFVVPRGALAPGSYLVRVADPRGPDCTATASAMLIVGAGPSLTRVMPARICASGGTLMLAGAGFASGATVTLTDGAAGTALVAAAVTIAGPTQATAVFGANGFANNTQLDLTWRNPDGCAAALPGSVRLKPGNGPCP